MFGPIGGGLTNGAGSPISSGATQGPTQSGATGTNGPFTFGNVNMGGLSGSHLTMIAIAIAIAYALVVKS